MQEELSRTGSIYGNEYTVDFSGRDHSAGLKRLRSDGSYPREGGDTEGEVSLPPPSRARRKLENKRASGGGRGRRRGSDSPRSRASEHSAADIPTPPMTHGSPVVTPALGPPVPRGPRCQQPSRAEPSCGRAEQQPECFRPPWSPLDADKGRPHRYDVDFRLSNGSFTLPRGATHRVPSATVWLPTAWVPPTGPQPASPSRLPSLPFCPPSHSALPRWPANTESASQRTPQASRRRPRHHPGPPDGQRQLSPWTGVPDAD
ncbi:uncharacterized protein LOC132396914 isoform X3 [Hypanus sabinus]|uniref:uncharacterized protein LOC132396914 isoform X3 n=1 Tax=Hypanus sabinus TaxID=79690 RepID=UPI0028C50A4A|nr:uncharacterized protein LOC132396914 isoform X3 [Hypanus sabinus]